MSEILLEQRGALGIVTLNRPQALNSLSLEVIKGLSEALTCWEKDSAVTAILIKGAGDRAFCAGGDMDFRAIISLNSLVR